MSWILYLKPCNNKNLLLRNSSITRTLIAVLPLRSLTAHMCRHESTGLRGGVTLLQPSFLELPLSCVLYIHWALQKACRARRQSVILQETQGATRAKRAAVCFMATYSGSHWSHLMIHLAGVCRRPLLGKTLSVPSIKGRLRQCGREWQILLRNSTEVGLRQQDSPREGSMRQVNTMGYVLWEWAKACVHRCGVTLSLKDHSLCKVLMEIIFLPASREIMKPSAPWMHTCKLLIEHGSHIDLLACEVLLEKIG